MTDSSKPSNLPRRGAARTGGDPLQALRLELAAVLLLVAAAYLATLGLAAAPWQEALALLAVASAGALWLIVRTRRAARRIAQRRAGHGEV